MRIYRNLKIEEIAAQRLTEYQLATGRSLSPPIPVDLVAEQVLRLDFLWDTIDEHPGETVLGGLVPKKRLIVLNEKHRDLFAAKPGLERSTKVHEMGHWDLYVDKGSLDHPALFQDGVEGPYVFRQSSVGEVTIIKKLMASAHGREALRKMQSRADNPHEATAVNRYAAALSMPPDLIRYEALKIDRTQWSNLYRLMEMFDVTITALRVRLEQLDLLYVDSNGKLYESKAAATGQGSLWN